MDHKEVIENLEKLVDLPLVEEAKEALREGIRAVNILEAISEICLEESGTDQPVEKPKKAKRKYRKRKKNVKETSVADPEPVKEEPEFVPDMYRAGSKSQTQKAKDRLFVCRAEGKLTEVENGVLSNIGSLHIQDSELAERDKIIGLFNQVVRRLMDE